MTDAELRALAEAATPGPWRSRKWRAPRMVEVIADTEPPIVPWSGFDDSARIKQEHDANANYIAAACNAVPSLLARAEKAEAALTVERIAAALHENFCSDPLDRRTLWRWLPADAPCRQRHLDHAAVLRAEMLGEEKV